MRVFCIIFSNGRNAIKCNRDTEPSNFECKAAKQVFLAVIPKRSKIFQNGFWILSCRVKNCYILNIYRLSNRFLLRTYIGYHGFLPSVFSYFGLCCEGGTDVLGQPVGYMYNIHYEKCFVQILL